MTDTFHAEYRLLENQGEVDEEDEELPPPENVIIQMPDEADNCCRPTSQFVHFNIKISETFEECQKLTFCILNFL